MLLPGLDASGKTTILYQLKFSHTYLDFDFVGLNIETVEHGKTKFAIWDISAKEKIVSS